MFSHARNPVILGGTFTNVTNPDRAKVNGFQLLLENVVKGAFHNSAERGDPPRCLPRTRVAIRADIMEWIQAPRSMRKLILWMYGPAGSGKTAIAQSIAEECERLGLLAASFFFWRSAAGRNNTDKFVATLAYQLSRHLPQIENHLVAAIESDPTIFTRSLSTQMRELVIEPMKRAVPCLPMPIAAIVDGVDECGPDGRAQSELLHQLGSIASELQHIPLIILISSRPECEIRDGFNGDHLSSLAKVLVLNNHYKPDEDIKLYFDSTFREIHDKNLRLGFRLPSEWPPANDVNFLVSKASGQFIFASTVTKFVDSSRHNPVDRLNMVLHLSNAENETPFAPLDALYRFILGSVADVEKVLEILTWLVLRSDFDVDLFPDEIEELLGFDIPRALVDMHSLVSVPPPTVCQKLEVYHASLFDFLTDRSRSLEYYIDKPRGYAFLARRWLKIIEFRAQSRISTRQAVNCFVHYCSPVESYPDEGLLDDLACFDLGTVLERCSNLNRDLSQPRWNNFMKCVNKQCRGREDIFPRLRNNFEAFILNCIDQYPQSLKPYIPILLLESPYTDDIFDILLHGNSKSAKEMNESRKLDERLLNLGQNPHLGSDTFDDITTYEHFSDFLKDAARAGKYFVHPGSYTALLKAIISMICTQFGERTVQIMDNYKNFSSQWFKDGFDLRIALLDTSFSWFPNRVSDILAQASIDLELANLLLERAVQFRDDTETIQGRRTIAQAGVEYIKRCGISFLEHTHQPHTKECAICTMCKDAVVLEAHETSAVSSVHRSVDKASAQQSKRKRTLTLESSRLAYLSEELETNKRRKY